MGFCKLDSRIIHSSIWSETYPTRLVWVTILAMADQNGFVGAAVPGLCRAANVAPDECNRALAVLSGPDPHSRSPEHDGRRIEAVEGGWRILNYQKYREYSYSSSPDAVRKREYRAKQAPPSALPLRKDKDEDKEKTEDRRQNTYTEAEAECPIENGTRPNMSQKMPKKEKIQQKFQRPTIEDVTKYCVERNNSVDANAWMSHYMANGWRVGRNPMRDWRAAIRTWERNTGNYPSGTSRQEKLGPREIRAQLEYPEPKSEIPTI